MSNRDALVCIYKSTFGSRWFNNLNWNTEVPISRWYGITIDEAGHAKSIILNQNRLEGELPPHNHEDIIRMSYLKHLKELSLSSNLLHGHIPPSISIFSSLTSLNLSWNNFHGHIPLEICELKKLTVLRLEHNHLTGPFPDYIHTLPLLRLINLSHNFLTGEMPLNIAQLNHLGYIDFTCNELIGIIPQTVQELKEMYLESLKDIPIISSSHHHRFVQDVDEEQGGQNEELIRGAQNDAADVCGYEAPLKYRTTSKFYETYIPSNDS